MVIEVVRPKASTGNNGRGGSANAAAGSVSSDDLFLRMNVSKREVLRGEPIVATLKLYTRVNLSDLGGFKAPDFNGFWSESLEQASNLNFQQENIDGQIYKTAVIQRHVLIPERTGKLTIDPAELTAVAQIAVQRQRSRSIFDQMFGSYQNVQKVLTSSKINITVNDLPRRSSRLQRRQIGNINSRQPLIRQRPKPTNPFPENQLFRNGQPKIDPRPKS
ncbi:MAG: BatD family protein [Saprospiraceae bacterium]